MNPVTLPETVEVLDSTKLKCMCTCPRKFFYEYVLGWRYAGRGQHDLYFGEAVHLAMEEMLLAKTYLDGIKPGLERAMAKLREYIQPEDDALYAPKDPTNLASILADYAGTYVNDHFEVIHIEVAGSVPIFLDAKLPMLYVKIDSVVQDTQGMWVIDHKTTGQETADWHKQFMLSVQIGAYLHAMRLLYGEAITGFIVNGLIFRKKGNALRRVQIRMGDEHMSQWLYNTQLLVMDVLRQLDKLSREDDGNEIMQSFPQRTESCYLYYKICQWHPFCCAWMNPLRRCATPPPGYEVYHWDPRDRMKDAKAILDGGVLKEGAKDA